MAIFRYLEEQEDIIVKPEFSIIMPVYNAEQFVVEAITSVLKQTFTNWELLICDDASTDKSLTISAETTTCLSVSVRPRKLNACSVQLLRSTRKSK